MSTRSVLRGESCERIRVILSVAILREEGPLSESEIIKQLGGALNEQVRCQIRAALQELRGKGILVTGIRRDERRREPVLVYELSKRERNLVLYDEEKPAKNT